MQERDQVVEAIVIEKVTEIPVTIGLHNIGIASVYEDRSVTIQFTDPDVGEEFFLRVFNGVPTGVTILT